MTKGRIKGLTEAQDVRKTDFY